MDGESLFNVLLMFLILFTEDVPVVTITNASQEILVAENSNDILQFICSGEPSSKLTWVQGGTSTLELSPDEPGISLSSDSLTLVLIINVAEADSKRLASKEGVPYYCLARNNLGTARSHAVTLRYPSEQIKRKGEREIRGGKRRERGKERDRGGGREREEGSELCKAVVCHDFL